jgi:hypothetical protein
MLPTLVDVDEPHTARRDALVGLGLNGPQWVTTTADGDGDAVCAATHELGLEASSARTHGRPERTSTLWSTISTSRPLQVEALGGRWTEPGTTYEVSVTSRPSTSTAITA